MERLPTAWSAGASLDGSVDELFSVRVGAFVNRRGVRPRALAFAGDQLLARAADPNDAADALVSALEVYVAERAPDNIILHAGVVGLPGGALVLPGRSGSGKTTLVRALLAAGAEYYSDEYAALDRFGRVVPYARPLSLRDPASGRPRLLSAHSLGAPIGAAPLAVQAVVIVCHAERGAWHVRRLSAARAMLALIPHAAPTRRRPAETLAALRRLVADAEVWAGERGEAADSVVRLAQLTERAGRRGQRPRITQMAACMGEEPLDWRPPTTTLPAIPVAKLATDPPANSSRL